MLYREGESIINNQDTNTNVWNIEWPDGSKTSEKGNLHSISLRYQPQNQYQILAVKINRQLHSLCHYGNLQSGNVKFLDYKHPDGQRVYHRSLTLLLLKAVNDLYPNRFVSVEHSLGKGIYCQLHDAATNELIHLTQREVDEIQRHMRELIVENLPFKKIKESLKEALTYFDEHKRYDLSALLNYRKKQDVSMYQLGDYKDYLFGAFVPSTSYLEVFALKFYLPGLIIRFPDMEDPNQLPKYTEQPKLFEIFRESQKWNKVLGVTTLTDVNRCIEEGNIHELILVNEGLHEKKVAKIADHITDSKDRIKVILIAGPSSSGKTSFAERLRVQLKVNGINAIPISVDNYFVDRENTPKHMDGSYNFESINAIDIDLFNNHLAQLIQGDAVAIPTYNFKAGRREYRGDRIQLKPYQPLIIEGIHCLNEKLTEQIPKGNKFKIYVSALTSLNFDRHNRIPTADIRLLRRIVRDHQYRGNSAQSTISMWQSVRKGEEHNIFPFQEEADVMFNSTLIYEIPLLKYHAEPLLNEIPFDSEEYVEAQRLLRFLSFVLPITPDTQIPCMSIIKEFIGNSCLHL